MPEVWLQSNRRVLGLALVPAALVGALGLGLLQASAAGLHILGWALVGGSLLLVAGLAR
jgi:hypothetical protein